MTLSGQSRRKESAERKNVICHATKGNALVSENRSARPRPARAGASIGLSLLPVPVKAARKLLPKSDETRPDPKGRGGNSA